MPWPEIIAALTFLLWLGLAWEVMRGCRRMPRLDRLQPPAPARWPRVSIVFGARNEAAKVEAAVRTMLALDYPDFEVIAVDDRSDDGTGAILDRLAADNARLRVDHVDRLLDGWLGKTHALQRGAEQAAGEWILFTDADVHFAPDALRRAVAHAVGGTLDHLSVIPRLDRCGHALGICVGAFSLIFTMFIRPWRIHDPRTRNHGGIGAFNLVRASTYRKLGGHTPLRLRPDDDLKLGKLMKAGGFSEMIFGGDRVAVEWYASVRQLVLGLTKNAYAGTDYRASLLLGGIAAHILFFFRPFYALFVTTGPALWGNAAAAALILLLAVDNRRCHGGPWWHGLFFPFGLLVLDYAMLRSFVVTHATRGVTWRGTHYPLWRLKANRL